MNPMLGQLKPGEPRPAHWFKPGQSGNPGGMQKGTPWRDALQRALKELDGEERGKTLQSIALAVIRKAQKANQFAVNEIATRLDGRVPLQIKGENGQSAFTQIVIVTGVPRPGDTSPPILTQEEMTIESTPAIEQALNEVLDWKDAK